MGKIKELTLLLEDIEEWGSESAFARARREVFESNKAMIVMLVGVFVGAFGIAVSFWSLLRAVELFLSI